MRVLVAALVSRLPLACADILFSPGAAQSHHVRPLAPRPSSRGSSKESGWGRWTRPFLPHLRPHLSQNKPPLQWHRAHRPGQFEATLFHRPGWGDFPLCPELPADVETAAPR